MPRLSPSRAPEDTVLPCRPGVLPPSFQLEGKRAAMVSFSPYPGDPRPRRAAEALLKQGMRIDLICLADDTSVRRERSGRLDILRLRIEHRRGGMLAYAYQYSAFILCTAALLAWRSLKRRYDLVYIHNMPDILVFSSVVPKALGANVILDQHDPMPELMKTIFKLDNQSIAFRMMCVLEKWSMACADSVLTVNLACKRLFSSRSCSPGKIRVVMNAPDTEIFQIQPPRALCPDRFVIMYHGSIVERNGLDLAVDALARIRAVIPVAELHIYGRHTAFLDQVMSDVQNRGLHDYVCYLGPKTLENLVAAIKDCDVGIIPNQRNAFTDINTPTRIFEYLALGKAVVAPRTPGIQDYFRADELFFFEPGNAEALASALESVFLDPREALIRVRRGQEILLAHSWVKEQQELTTVVRELLNQQ